MTRAHRLVLDCDPGHDDVVAILLASQLADLRAITTVSGNAPLDKTTHNALVATTVFGLDTPVHPGAAQPLVVKPSHAPQIHGESGLAGPSLPDPVGTPRTTTAVELLLAEARATDDLWIVATGPLTNIALALRAGPELTGSIAGISIMGGGLGFGNVTPAAEFNIWADPEAAAIVVSSGLPLVVCPLDVTHQVMVRPDFISRLRATNAPAATFMADLFGHFAEAYADVFFEDAAGPLHDPCAVLALTHPHLFEFTDLNLEVGLSGAARGMTIADQRSVKRPAPPNARVAVGVQADVVLDLVAVAIEQIGRTHPAG